MAETSSGIRIRPAVRLDRDWVLLLAPRLHEFGPPPFRDVSTMDAAVAREIQAGFDRPGPETAILVAEDSGSPAGFVFLVTDRDYFTGEAHGHISDLVVSPEAEGRGVGRALLAASEEWASGRGYRFLTLNVFEENRRARTLYEKAGYTPEMTKFVKELR